MRVAREILRLKFEARLSHRQIGRACGVSCSTVSEAVGRFQAAGLSWPLPAELPDSALGGAPLPRARRDRERHPRARLAARAQGARAQARHPRRAVG